MIGRLLAALALVALAGPAFAEDAGVQAQYSPAYSRCLAQPEGQSTAGMIDCIGAEFTVQDGKLNAQYRETLAGLNARQKAKLVAAERAWIAYRDAECASFQDEDWGTLSRVTANTCMLDTTIARRMALEAYPPQ